MPYYSHFQKRGCKTSILTSMKYLHVSLYWAHGKCFDEIPKHVTGIVGGKVQIIKSAKINEDTPHCIDYDNTTVLLCRVLHDNTADS